MLVRLVAVALGMASPPDEADWLRWDVPDACPEAAYMVQATTDRLGRTPTRDDAIVTVSIADHGADGLALTLQTEHDGLSDTRAMTAHNCLALADAAGLLVALSIDPVAVAEHVDTTEEPRPVPVAVPAQPVPGPRPVVVEVEPQPEPRATPLAPPADEASAAPPVDPRPQDIMLGVGGGVELGALPGVSGGPNVVVAVGWRRLRVEAAGWYAAPRTEVVGAASVAVQVGAATVRACARLQGPRIEVPLCGGLELGRMHGRGQGTPDAKAASQVWFSPTVGAGVHGWLTPRLALLARAELAVPLVFPAFEIRDPGEPVELFRPGSVSGRFWIGIEGKLWSRDGLGGRRRTNR